MKTSIDIDGARLDRVQKLTQLKTRKATIDYALREAERAARLARLLREAAPGSEFGDAIDPAYDLIALRARDKRQPCRSSIRRNTSSSRTTATLRRFPHCACALT